MQNLTLRPPWKERGRMITHRAYPLLLRIACWPKALTQTLKRWLIRDTAKTQLAGLCLTKTMRFASAVPVAFATSMMTTRTLHYGCFVAQMLHTKVTRVGYRAILSVLLSIQAPELQRVGCAESWMGAFTAYTVGKRMTYLGNFFFANCDSCLTIDYNKILSLLFSVVFLGSASLWQFIFFIWGFKLVLLMYVTWKLCCKLYILVC